MSQFLRNAFILSTALGMNTAHGQRLDPFIVHEWGTFTSLQGSDGKIQEGMHHEEERLPGFVQGRCGSGTVHGDAKCADFVPIAHTPLAVTQKMETPVIYFYGGEGQSAEVTVGFPKGIISQWFPAAAGFAPQIGTVQAVAGGSMTWQVDIKAVDAPPTHKVPEGDSWQYAREVDANAVSVGNSTEKYIFYRGLGNFDAAVRVQSDAAGQLRVSNGSSDLVPAVFLLGFDGEKGFVQAIGPMTARQSVLVPASPGVQLSRDVYLEQAQGLVKDALVDSGLYPKEAQGMVKTWEKSYFLTAGLRVLYILPRRWTDSILPLSVKPEPKETVRTLVGRIEVMTRQEEVDALEGMTAALKKGSFDMTPWGRLQESKLRRVLALSQDPLLTQALQKALDQLDVCQKFPCM